MKMGSHCRTVSSGRWLLNPLLKLAPVLGARHHAAEVQGERRLPLRSGTSPWRQSSGQTLSQGGFADTRLTDGRGCSWCGGTNLGHRWISPVPADDRVPLARGRPGEVLAGSCSCRVLLCGAGAGVPGSAALTPPGATSSASHSPYRRRASFTGGSSAQCPFLLPSQDARQQVFGAHVVVTALHGVPMASSTTRLARGVRPWADAAGQTGTRSS